MCKYVYTQPPPPTHTHIHTYKNTHVARCLLSSLTLLATHCNKEHLLIISYFYFVPPDHKLALDHSPDSTSPYCAIHTTEPASLTFWSWVSSRLQSLLSQLQDAPALEQSCTMSGQPLDTERQHGEHVAWGFCLWVCQTEGWCVCVTQTNWKRLFSRLPISHGQLWCWIKSSRTC